MVMRWVSLHGSITPAKMAGEIFEGQMFGSETSKRCRELRKPVQGKWKNPYGKQMLDSVKDGRFEKYFSIEITARDTDRMNALDEAILPKKEEKVESQPVEARLF